MHTQIRLTSPAVSAHVPDPGMAQRHPLTSTLDLQQPATYFHAIAQLCHNTQGPTMLPWDPAPDVSALWQVSGVPQDHLPAERAAQAHDRRPQRSGAPFAGVHGPPGKGLHPRPAVLLWGHGPEADPASAPAAFFNYPATGVLLPMMIMGHVRMIAGVQPCNTFGNPLVCWCVVSAHVKNCHHVLAGMVSQCWCGMG